MTPANGTWSLLLLAVSAGITAATAGDDTTSLLQVDTVKSTMPESCRCKIWADIYQAWGILPGVGGPEMIGANLSNEPEENMQEISQWYFDLNTTWCANMFFNESMDQWCYVSSDCPDLNGGWRSEGPLSYKYCKPGTEDQMLNQLTALEAYRWGVREARDAAWQMKMSFPHANRDILWNYFQDYFSSGLAHSMIEKRAEPYLATLRARGTPLIIDRLERSVSFGIIEGTTAWEMRHARKWYDAMINRPSKREMENGVQDVSSQIISKNRDRNFWLICQGGCDRQEKTSMPTLRSIIQGLPGEDSIEPELELGDFDIPTWKEYNDAEMSAS